MNKLTVDFSCSMGKMKPMHAVNNGPVYRSNPNQMITNYHDYKVAGIPYARNHDASFFSTYGGEHTVDVNFIFPDFDADPYDEASYDFACTDEYIKVTEMAGTETYYRLGTKIEHGVKKYNTLPPKDFKKWAVICEHIIRHYNEGWANGFHYNLTYWEIWNEPDMHPDDAPNKTTWGGTRDEFFEFYVTAASHLKGNFPQLKIGGPAMVYVESEWMDLFLQRLTRDEKRVPLDFLSWHTYNDITEPFVRKIKYVREILDKYGFTETESILNEWNYMKGWAGDEYLYSINTHFNLKGAAFTAAVMCEGQRYPLDMLMYYDARPCGFNGLWKPYTYERLKGYYPFYAFNVLYRLGENVKTEVEAEHLYACAARNEREAAILLVHYDDEAYDHGAHADGVTFRLDVLGMSKLSDSTDSASEMPGVPDSVSSALERKPEYYLLDEAHDLELVPEELCRSGNEICLKHNTMLLIRYRQ